MAQPDTVVRILDTAEHLFAERGFAETSLRTITSRAGVNLAAVNYHFGSKKSLIQAVFERFLTPFCAALDAALDRRLADSGGRAMPLDELLGLIAHTVSELHARDAARSVVFMRLVGLAYNESQGHMRRYLWTQYGHTFTRLERLLAEAMPDIPREERFWRMHFALGSVVFTLSGLAPLQAVAAAEYSDPPDFSTVVMRLLPFLVGGIRQGGVA